MYYFLETGLGSGVRVVGDLMLTNGTLDEQFD